MVQGCPIDHSSPAEASQGCPVDHSSSSKTAAEGCCPVDHTSTDLNALNPMTMMPYLPQQRLRDQVCFHTCFPCSCCDSFCLTARLIVMFDRKKSSLPNVQFHPYPKAILHQSIRVKKWTNGSTLLNSNITPRWEERDGTQKKRCTIYVFHSKTDWPNLDNNWTCILLLWTKDIPATLAIHNVVNEKGWTEVYFVAFCHGHWQVTEVTNILHITIMGGIDWRYFDGKRIGTQTYLLSWEGSWGDRRSVCGFWSD